MSVLETLTEGIKERSLQQEGAALLAKWDKTGLLEGLGSDYSKNTMARLLENQASQLLKEASSMAGGDVQGFASVAFPIVRRVFGGLIANDLVSVQPMSLPSGLIFFMDFTFNETRLGSTQDYSLYGGGKVGSQITGGVDLDYNSTTGIDGAETSFYALNNAYSSPTGTVSLTPIACISGTVGGADASVTGFSWASQTLKTHADFGAVTLTTQEMFDYITRDDVDLSGTLVTILATPLSNLSNLNLDDFIGITPTPVSDRSVRRLQQFNPLSASNVSAGAALLMAVAATGTNTMTSKDVAYVESLQVADAITYPLADGFSGGDAVGSVVGGFPWGLEGAPGSSNQFNGQNVNNTIPEIDIKVDSIAVTAITKKLKAKWTPELGQDLNAYHNLDAEVELTQILSEQIALEIDREILSDLVNGAKAGHYFWSRAPGKFVIKETGAETGATTAAPDFTGNVSEWYETLVETINDISAQIHRKTLRGGANFIVVSPEVASILEFTAGFRANVTVDSDVGTVGAMKVGSLSKKWDVYVDPYFLRNVVLVGRKGGSFLESGYVYAPYVPLQVTPTIFGTEDFVPRKGVMTRYAKKMVRPDMYGLVVVRDMLG